MAKGNAPHTVLVTREVETVQGRNARYCQELKQKVHLTGKKKGELLNPAEAGYRMGVLSEQKKSQKRFKFKNPGYQRKTTNPFKKSNRG